MSARASVCRARILFHRTCRGLESFPLEDGLVRALGKMDANVPHLLEGIFHFLPRVKLLTDPFHVPHAYVTLQVAKIDSYKRTLPVCDLLVLNVSNIVDKGENEAAHVALRKPYNVIRPKKKVSTSNRHLTR